MIKAIVIDVGGVFLKGTRNDVFSYLSEKFKVDFQNSIGELYNEFNNGKFQSEEFFKKVSEKLKLDESSLKKAWLEAIELKFKIDENIENLVKDLKNSGYKIVTITNTNKFHFDFHKRVGHYKYFDLVIASCEVGLQKPDERIYFILMERLGLKAEEIIVIDNYGDNLTTAKKLGMKIIVYENLEQLRNSLSNLGIK